MPGGTFAVRQGQADSPPQGDLSRTAPRNEARRQTASRIEWHNLANSDPSPTTLRPSTGQAERLVRRDAERGEKIVPEARTQSRARRLTVACTWIG